METSDILSVLSLIMSGVALYKSNDANNRANELQSASNDVQMGLLEIQIREMIENARKEFDEIATQLKSGSCNDSVLLAKLKSAKESYVNAYDEACTKYLDGKIDKSRFKKTYDNEIRNLVESEVFKELYMEPQTKYKATVKVYKEWNDNEGH